MSCPGPDCPPFASTGKCPLHYNNSITKFISAADRMVAYRKRKKKLEENLTLKPIKQPKTNAELCKEFRERKKLQQVSLNSKQQKTIADRAKEYRNRKQLEKLLLKRSNNDDDEDCDIPTKQSKTIYPLADYEFEKRFRENTFGHICDVCDRIWFQNDMSTVGPKGYSVLQDEFPGEDVTQFQLCGTCKDSVYKNKIPYLSRTNGFVYPEYPSHLPTLDPITERLVSPRLPFMQIRRLRYEHGSKSIIGQVVNVPVDVNNMVLSLPRELDDDYAFNVHIKRHQIHKSSYLKGFVKKSVIKPWLSYLLKTPLYQYYQITVDSEFFTRSNITRNKDKDAIELITKKEDYDSELLLAQQQTLMWSEDKYLCIAPGQNKMPFNVIFDEHAEELSFPAIYLGHPRTFKDGVRVTPFMIATSEIRRRDRRGVTPEHILYMGMKIMRLRLHQGLYQTFKVSGDTAQITKKMIENKQFVEQCVDNNLAFLKSIPNSVNYWQHRKKDLFAMIRQLGKPTLFLTLSASEPRWSDLLQILYKLKNGGTEYNGDPMEQMSSLQRCTLVNEDPVACNLYFNKLVDVIMYILKSKTCSPFGEYRVVDFFKRIEFQHRGSPHSHILLWLANTPNESIGEDMPKTIALINQLCSVDANELEYSKCQTHKHTFTCYKNNDKKCRFGAPFWPMQSTHILLPIPQDDGRREGLRKKYKSMHQDLEQNNNKYKTLDAFLKKHNIVNEEHYFNVIRAGISRPMVFLKRGIDQVWMNSFNPWIASTLRSNMDIQFILEEYSCAVYVVEYVNKTNRGISGLHRDLIKLREEYPDKDYTELLKEVSLKMLNSVELSSQEAAWYLLRLGMSESSRKVTYIPTTWPHERCQVVKTRKELEAEELDDESIDIWKESYIQKYERRPRDTLAEVTLAQFVSKYYKTKGGVYKLREIPRVIRSRQYDMSDTDDYKREMVLLHYPFFDEEVDILDSNKFLNIYDTHENLILSRSKEFASDIDVAKTMEYCRQLCNITNENEDAEEKSEVFAKSKQVSDDFIQALSSNNDDIKLSHMSQMSSIIRKRENVMSSEQYCRAMRMTNKEQRELLLEVIHRLSGDGDSEPLQIFFTGPAGCGKTFTMKLLMETYNRFAQNHDSVYNAYVACASTGKAATAINGTTVHSAFRISLSRSDHGLSIESLNSFRTGFKNVCCIFIDEVSMIGAELLEILNSRLQQINMEFDKPFGGFNIVFCGDLRQLPPVMATPIYKRCRKRFNNQVLWQSLQFYPLVQVVRQQDAMFSSILTKIGNGDRLTEEETSIIESRFFPTEEINRRFPRAIRLFLKNEHKDAYNSQVIKNNRQTIEHVALDTYSGYKNNEQLVSMRTRVHKMKNTDTAGLPYILNLLLGTPYMITSNIDVLDGLVNGAIGILKYIEYGAEPDDGIKRLWLHFDEPKIGRLLKAKVHAHVIANGLNTNWIPISKRTTNISFKTKSLLCKRLQFPIVEACALTIHKSQGGTYDNIVYDYNKNHNQQLVYVALSRATSLQGLYLTLKLAKSCY